MLPDRIIERRNAANSIGCASRHGATTLCDMPAPQGRHDAD